jgi:hypothetical protein
MRATVVLLAVLAAPPAWGWGCDAHRMVALIASARLGDGARAAATALLRAHPIAPDERGCRAASRNALADVAMWADAIRDDERETAPWHYVELGRDAAREDVARACPSGRCVTGALARQLDVLRSGAADATRARALRFVVHLVADLHQPLHAAGNGDRGGNCVPVTWFGDTPRSERRGERWHPNLHAVWDTALVSAILAREHATATEYAEALRRRRADDIARWQRADVRIDEWAWETHRVGVDVAYGKLSPPIPAEPRVRLDSCRGNREIGRRMAALDVRLDEAYVDAVRSAVDTQLAKAGARLAAVLEAAFR